MKRYKYTEHSSRQLSFMEISVKLGYELYFGLLLNFLFSPINLLILSQYFTCDDYVFLMICIKASILHYFFLRVILASLYNYSLETVENSYFL